MGGVVEAASNQAFQYGILGFVCVIFAAVIVYLYREGKAERAAFAEERAKWQGERDTWHMEREQLRSANAKQEAECDVEKQTLRAEYEKKHREVIEGYAHQLSQIRQQQERREDDINRANDMLIEKLSNSAKSVNDAMVEMLGKLHDRITK